MPRPTLCAHFLCLWACPPPRHTALLGLGASTPESRIHEDGAGRTNYFSRTEGRRRRRGMKRCAFVYVNRQIPGLTQILPLSFIPCKQRWKRNAAARCPPALRGCTLFGSGSFHSGLCPHLPSSPLCPSPLHGCEETSTMCTPEGILTPGTKSITIKPCR